MIITGFAMAENLYSPEQKATSESYRVNYDLIFRDPETNMEQATAQLLEIITGEPHKIVVCRCNPGDCDCGMEQRK